MLYSDLSMKERITLTSDFKPLPSQPDGPWQAGAGGFFPLTSIPLGGSYNMMLHKALLMELYHRNEFSLKGLFWKSIF